MKRDPKREKITFAVILIAVVVIFIVAINYYQYLKTPFSSSNTKKEGSLIYSIRMSDTEYGLGEPIGMEMEVRNIGTKPVTLKFDESLEYDFIVQKEANYIVARLPKRLWSYSANIGSKPENHTVTLQPQEVKVYKAKWDQKDNTGRQVAPGNYIITGIINTAGQSTELQMRGRMNK